MKYVYVLTSADTDIYYEQFLLSLTSLRFYNPDAEVIALTDEKTRHTLTGKRAGYEKLLSELRVINVQDKFSQKEASRWIKTSIHHHVTGDFLFIDCDTVIAENLDFNYPSNIKVGAVLDTHVTLDNHHLCKNFQMEDSGFGFSSSLETNTRYNGGVILCKNDPQAIGFYEKWHSLWIDGLKKGCSQDMPSLNQANYEMNNAITELSGDWNCQLSHNGLVFLQNAKIIHYFATSLTSSAPAYKLASPAVFASIREEGELSPEVMEHLKNPKSAFEPITRIISDKAIIDALDGSLFIKLVRFSRRHPFFFKAWNTLKSGGLHFAKRMFKK